MGTFEELVRFEVANSAVAFRERAYRLDDRQELLRDLLGLANAASKGPRYVVLGVKDRVGGERQLLGIRDAQADELGRLCSVVVPEFTDPPLKFRIDRAVVYDVTIAAIVLLDCDDPPYLLKKNASSSMRVGNGWIRQGTQYKRLARADLERMFESKFLGRTAAADLRVGFASASGEAAVCLPVLPLDQLPSADARRKLSRLLMAKQATRGMLGKVGSRIERLVHAQVFGESELYAPHNTTTLLKRLDHTEEACESADLHYAHEVRAHKLNLLIENLGSVSFDRGTLLLEFPRIPGLEIAERLYLSAETGEPAPDGYPTVAVGPRMVRVQASVGPVQPGNKALAFRQPLRVGLREPCSGQTIPVSYSLHGRALRASLSGSLRITCVEHRFGSRPP